MLRIETSSTRETAGHAVQFYEDDGFLTEVVADFLAAGLRMGHPCLVIATPEHRDAIEKALGRLRPADASTVVFLDARETLRQFMTDGRPDSARFAASIGRLVAEVAESAPGHAIHAFGEMVNLLCADRLAGAAIELEKLWNDLIAGYALNLLCAYRTGTLTSSDGGATFDQVCGCHREVWPTQRLATQPDDASRLRHVARLEHRVRDFDPVSADGRDMPALIDTERAARIQFESAASHELRNPVHVLRLQLRAALRALAVDEVPDPTNIRRRLERAEAQAERVSNILDAVLSPRIVDN